MKKIILAAMLAVSTMVSTDVMAQGVYIGGNMGTTVNNHQRVDLGGSVGYQFTPYVAGEFTYDYRKFERANNVMMVNVVGQLPTGTIFTPYVLVGTGIAVDGSRSAMAYNVGTGVKIAVTDNVAFDARYRYTDTFNSLSNRPGDNSFTLGVNYRF